MKETFLEKYFIPFNVMKDSNIVTFLFTSLWMFIWAIVLAAFFHDCENIPNRQTLKGGEICFWSWFQRVSFWSAGCSTFGSQVR